MNSTMPVSTQLSKFDKLSQISGHLAQESSSEDVRLNDENVQQFWSIANRATIENPWFTKENIKLSLQGLSSMLEPQKIEKWLQNYPDKGAVTSHRVGMVLAGNIPMVGFHDIFTTLVAGHKPVVKQSQQDKLLLPALFQLFEKSTGNEGIFEVEWIEGKLPEVDAIIATGSNNTSRYFEYYFSKYPHIIRKNRSSVAILSGDESEEELKKLGHDIFSYFGMGCRNVSKVYFPENFDTDRFFKAIYDFKPIINSHKYANNVDYYRALWLMNSEDILENGFLILRPSEALHSPIATLFYETYKDEEKVRESLNLLTDQIQRVVSRKDTPFGKSQSPELWDYADGIDTMAFLLELPAKK
jgi:hypothetical protein